MLKVVFVCALTIAVALPRIASAQSVLEVIAGVKFCRTLKDDSQRLKCFDSLGSDKAPDRAPASKPEMETSWQIADSKSPLDDSPEITATLQAIDGRGLLVFRCKEKRTEAFFAPEGFINISSGTTIRVLTRIGQGKLIDTRWNGSTTGRGVFAPSAIQFMRALPDDEKLFLRAFDFQGNGVDGEFKIGKVSEVRDRIAHACFWPGQKSSGSK